LAGRPGRRWVGLIRQVSAADEYWAMAASAQSQLAKAVAQPGSLLDVTG
jgi:hypothetical protein